MTVLLTDRTGSGVLTLTFNRPDVRNALNEELAVALAEALDQARTDDSTHVVILTGAGTAFCAGGDVKDFERDRTAEEQHTFLRDKVYRIARSMTELDKPVIAMINGPAMGAGLDIALLCDLRFAADDALLAEAYIDVGAPPGDGGAWLLPRIVGTARALDLLWTGRRISGKEALEIGLVDRCLPADELRSVTVTYAEQLAAGPQTAIRITKRALYQSLTVDLRTHLDQMASHMAVVRATADYREGVEALREKRTPRFGGGKAADGNR